MYKNRKFPKNWEFLSEKEQRANIEYLLEHYKEYKIESYYNGRHMRVQIGNQVSISKHYTLKGNIYIINGEVFCNTKDLDGLFDACIREAYEQKGIKEEKREKIRNYGTVGGVAVFIVFIFAMALHDVRVYETRKLQKKEKAKQERIIEDQIKKYEQSLPGYLEQKQMVANYRDSLLNAKMK